ncbi:MAG: diaminopimelate epimerase [Phycisphaerae bacterium]
MRFTKMHGLGNDFVVVSLFDQHVADPAALARAVGDRRRGVGSDGLILVAPPADEQADVCMIMFNPDGSRAEMCGNGIRCLARLVHERGLVRRNPLRVATDAGVLPLELNVDAAGDVYGVRVAMGRPVLEPQRIPVSLAGDRVVRVPLSLGDLNLTMTCLSMGNPHAVFFTPDLAGVPVADWGPRIETHALFPQRINVHFVQVLSRSRVRMATWERGAGLTQACGTGACAVCVAGVLNDLTERTITAELPGGELELHWDQQSAQVYMTGPATEVFTGTWPD